MKILKGRVKDTNRRTLIKEKVALSKETTKDFGKKS